MSRNLICTYWRVIQYGCGPVAQWIERLRPKEKVVRSTRIWATIDATNVVTAVTFFFAGRGRICL